MRASGKTKGIALGHRRLAIVDLSQDGHQPMTTADGALTAVVNGEIYNYPDLRPRAGGQRRELSPPTATAKSCCMPTARPEPRRSA